MKTKLNIIEQLKPHYFWDIDFSRINATANKRLIIERIITYGTLDEIDLIVENYGRAEVIKVVQKLTCLDPKTLNFISKLFEIPKNDFKCYGKPLKSKHWNL